MHSRQTGPVSLSHEPFRHAPLGGRAADDAERPPDRVLCDRRADRFVTANHETIEECSKPQPERARRCDARSELALDLEEHQDSDR